ncbi:MAG: hypothetical protein A2X94_09280 [Bdellovibrionales bacterium GWB1_55_8]|nr:MAG: hypothetical protein A2X94_09280 [Bdellovibrionales bacterium GWB1_55_8]
MIETPVLLFSAVLFLLASGLLNLIWGRRFPRQFGWMTGFGLTVLFASAVYGWNELIAEGELSKIFSRGWILPYNEPGAVTVGIYQDALGLVAIALISILSGFMMLDTLTRAPGADCRRERVVAAISMNCAGIALAWLALTPWLSVIGISITALGGFLALGDKWGESDEEAISATRYAWAKWWGIILICVGAGILAAARTPLLWGADSEWARNIHSHDEMGTALLFAGLFIQLQSFPFVTWVTSSSSGSVLKRVFLNQLGPGFAAFALLIRLEPHLRQFNAFTVFGWIALFSAIITSAIGLLQPTWRQSLACWISAGFATAFSILFFSGAPGALGFLIGLLLGGLILAATMNVLGKKEAVAGGMAPGWLRFLAFLGVAAGTGLAGFVSAVGILQWITSGALSSGWAAVPILMYFLFSLNGWSLAWGTLKTRPVSRVSWYHVLCLVLIGALSLAFVWTGTITAGFFGVDESFAPSLLNSLFLISSSTPEGPLTLTWAYAGLQLLSFGLAYWMVGRKRDLWLALREVFPRGSNFISSGFRLDEVATSGFRGTRKAGLWMHWLVESVVWDSGMARGLTFSIKKVADTVSRADAGLSAALLHGLAKTVSAPAKFLQLIQNGDVQWYLLFAIGSGAAILLHFLISKGLT